MDDPPGHESIDELARKVCREPLNEAAWSLLYSLTYKTLFRLVLARVGNHEDARDLLQDTWLKFAAKPDRYEPARPFMPWIYQVLNNTVKDFWRRTGREPEFLGLEAVIVLPERDEGVDAALDRELLRELLEGLTPIIRQALVDHYVGGLPFRDIAEALDVPESTLRGRLNTAIAQLQRRSSPEVGQRSMTNAQVSEENYGQHA